MGSSSSTYHQKRGHMFFLEQGVQSVSKTDPGYIFK